MNKIIFGSDDRGGIIGDLFLDGDIDVASGSATKLVLNKDYSYHGTSSTDKITLTGTFTVEDGVWSGDISRIVVDSRFFYQSDVGERESYIRQSDPIHIEDIAAFLTGGVIAVQLLLNGDDALTGISKGYGGNDSFSLVTITGAAVDGGTGFDTVDFSGASSAINLRVYQMLDQFKSIERFVGTRLADQMRGSAGDDTLEGNLGNDLLIGREGNDTLIGGSGDDRFIGGLGRDVMTGGSGKDTFVFENITESPTGVRDKITDFNRADDLIDLRLIDANTEKSGNQAFTFIGTAAFSGAGAQLRTSYNATSDSTYVWGDVDGDKHSDFEFIVSGHIKLTSLDFQL